MPRRKYISGRILRCGMKYWLEHFAHPCHIFYKEGVGAKVRNFASIFGLLVVFDVLWHRTEQRTYRIQKSKTFTWIANDYTSF